MNLLLVSPNLPCPSSGASTRNYYLLRALARKYKVSLVALVSRAELEQTSNISRLESITQTVQVIARSKPRSKRLQQVADLVRGKSSMLNSHTSQEVQDAIERLFARNRYDVVLFESVLIAGYLLPEDVKIVIDQHNIEHELLLRTFQRERAWLRKWYNWLENRLLKPVEIQRCMSADVVLVTSERERLSLESTLQNKAIEVVPNGVDIEYFHGNDVQQEVPGRIIFTGAMDYYPNVDAVQFFAQQCWPLIRARVPDATWQIVGRNPLPEVWKLSEIPGVTVTGSVPDVRPYLTAAEVAIVPLRIAGGTRLKILEALAMRKAVVSTSIGREGLSVESTMHLVVEDEPKRFALSVIKLLGSSELRTSLGNAGRKLVEAEYSWDRCGDMLLHALEKFKLEGKSIC